MGCAPPGDPGLAINPGLMMIYRSNACLLLDVYGVVVYGVGRPGLTTDLRCAHPSVRPGTRALLKAGECLIPPARQLGLTRRGDLLKAGAYATPTWSSGQRVAKILISIIWMTGRDVLVGLPGMWSQLRGLGSAPETIWPAVISIAASSRPPFHGKHWRLAPEGGPYASLPLP
jgi:hypothetical protein